MTDTRSLPTSPIALFNTTPKCRCLCFTKPQWVIPSVANLYNVNNSDQTVPLSNMKLEGTINNSIANVKFTQVYKNDSEVPLECVYKFPTDPSFAIAGLKVKIGDKEIQAEVMEKQKAEEKYDDAVAAGNTGIKLNYDKKLPDIIELTVGALQPSAEAEITIQIVSELEVIKHGFFSYVFPIEFIPKYGAPDEVVGGGGSFTPCGLSMDFKISSNSTITNLFVSHDGFEHEQSEDGFSVNLKLNSDTPIIAKDFVISYSSEGIREPTIRLARSDKYAGQVSAHISFIPRSSEEHEDDDEEVKDTEIHEVDDKDDPEVANGEFIFIIDRSGSMGGNRIKLAKEALALFIRSLPPDSLFNVVSFGSTHSLMFPQSKAYDNDSMNKALDNISSFKSDLGGTKLLEPITSVLTQKDDYQYPKNVFVLTDGAIGNTHEVISKIEEFNHVARVHSFGIGSGTSKYLVNELAHSGKGTATHISDNDSQIKAKVIRALKMAAKPAFTNVSIDWKDNNDAVTFSTPKSPHFENIYEEEPFNLYAVLSEDSLKESNLTLTFFNTHEQTEETLVLQIDPSKIEDSLEGYEFQIAARRHIDFVKKFETSGDKTKIMTDASIKYQVLCEHTAFFGKVKNKDKSKAEMETINIPVTKLQLDQPRYGGSIGGAMFMRKAKKRKMNKNFGYEADQMASLSSLENSRRRVEEVRCMTDQNIKMMCRNIDSAETLEAKSSSLKAASINFEKSAKKQSSGGFFSAIGGAITGLFSSKKKAKPGMAMAPPQSAAAPTFVASDNMDEGNSPLQLESACVRKSPVKTSIKNIESKKIEGNYLELATYQDSTGYFTDLPSSYQKLLSLNIPESISQIVEDKDDLLKAWTTILAICILKKHFKDSQDEWTMIVKKAESYLKSSLHIKDYKSEIKNALKLV